MVLVSGKLGIPGYPQKLRPFHSEMIGFGGSLFASPWVNLLVDPTDLDLLKTRCVVSTG
jgi:hypothetical protein